MHRAVFAMIGAALLLQGCGGKPAQVASPQSSAVQMSPGEARRFLHSPEAVALWWTISNQASGRGAKVAEYRVIGNSTLEIVEQETARRHAFPLRQLSLDVRHIALGTTVQIHLADGWFMWGSTSSTRDAHMRRLIAAVRTLQAAQRGEHLSDPDEERTFAEHARRYRETAQKPDLPEEARRHKVRAEHLVTTKRFDDAVEQYEQALRVAPWWPEGRFNRGLILGELGRYGEAIVEMNRYLVLVPNAPNARAVQDRIYVWEAELTQSEKSRPSPAGSAPQRNR